PSIGAVRGGLDSRVGGAVGAGFKQELTHAGSAATPAKPASLTTSRRVGNARINRSHSSGHLTSRPIQSRFRSKVLYARAQRARGKIYWGTAVAAKPLHGGRGQPW